MNRKTILLSIMLLVLSLLTINAQQETNVEERLSKLKERLNLTEDQSKEIKTILTEAQEKAAQIRADNSGSKRSMFKELRSLFETTNSRINSQLNDEQKEEYKKIVEETKQNFKSRRK